jgi:thiosulfate/3-mercaptopyruvate sulfurtransferase
MKNVRMVAPDWVAGRLGDPAVTLVDPRRPMKYLSGHLPGAINIPVYKTFGPEGRLLSPASLAEFIGASGLGDSSMPVLYDSPEGQNAAMLAWILEYLGRADIHLMDAYFEDWKAASRDVFYKPVEAPPKVFTPKVNATVRATLEEVRAARGVKLVDFRSREEFDGERAMGQDPPGHIAGAVNIVWRELAAPPQRLLAAPEKIERMLAEAGIRKGDKVIAYCRSGPRASLGYLALRELGYDVRLFDGSYAEWAGAGLPVEK